jgi:hypothetical protein
MQYDQPTNQPTGQNHPFHGTTEGGRGGIGNVDGWLSVCKLVCPFPPGQENKWIAQSTRLSDAKKKPCAQPFFFSFLLHEGTVERAFEWIAINRHSHSNTHAKKQVDGIQTNSPTNIVLPTTGPTD